MMSQKQQEAVKMLIESLESDDLSVIESAIRRRRDKETEYQASRIPFSAEDWEKASTWGRSQFINAIKMVREKHGVGLLVAKMVVDKFRESLKK